MTSSSTDETSSDVLSIHLVGDAFADLFCFLENGMPIPGGDSRLSVPIETMAGGSAVNTTTHLTCLLENFGGAAPSVVMLYTSVNPNDEYGRMLIQHAEKHGFPLINCRKEDSGCATGHCVVIVSNNDRSFMTHQGCMHEFCAHDLHIASLVEPPDNNTCMHHSHIHIAGFYNIPGFWDGKLKEMLEKIRLEREKLPCQTTTTFSLVPQHDATEEWDGGLLELLPLLDFCIMNELEADCISRRNKNDNNTDAIQHWAHFFASASRKTCVIVTQGPCGAVALYNGNVIATQAAVNVQVVDPTGAGDAFASGFLHGLWNWRQQQAFESELVHDDEWPIEAIQQGLYWGCSVASCSVQMRGASVPSPPELIQEFLDKTAKL